MIKCDKCYSGHHGHIQFVYGDQIMSLYSLTKGKSRSRRTIDDDLRFKMPRFCELKRQRPIGMLFGEVSHSSVGEILNIHRTLV